MKKKKKTNIDESKTVGNKETNMEMNATDQRQFPSLSDT
jgi:hypothetical protein